MKVTAHLLFSTMPEPEPEPQPKSVLVLASTARSMKRSKQCLVLLAAYISRMLTSCFTFEFGFWIEVGHFAMLLKMIERHFEEAGGLPLLQRLRATENTLEHHKLRMISGGNCTFLHSREGVDRARGDRVPRGRRQLFPREPRMLPCSRPRFLRARFRQTR